MEQLEGSEADLLARETQRFETNEQGVKLGAKIGTRIGRNETETLAPPTGARMQVQFASSQQGIQRCFEERQGVSRELAAQFRTGKGACGKGVAD
jgi:hypothetical protein